MLNVSWVYQSELMFKKVLLLDTSLAFFLVMWFGGQRHCGRQGGVKEEPSPGVSLTRSRKIKTAQQMLHTSEWSWSRLSLSLHLQNLQRQEQTRRLQKGQSHKVRDQYKDDYKKGQSH